MCTRCESYVSTALTDAINEDTLVQDYAHRSRAAAPWNNTLIQKPASQRKVHRLVVAPESGEGPGLEVDVVDGKHIFVVAILEGVFARANAMFWEHPVWQLQPGDRIVEVNTCRGEVGEIIAELQKECTWDVRFQHPTEFKCEMFREGTDSLGMDLRFAPGGNTLLIHAIGPGPVAQWNANMDSRKQFICVLDRIIEMNGVRGTPAEMLKASTLRDPIEMTVLSYG